MGFPFPRRGFFAELFTGLGEVVVFLFRDGLGEDGDSSGAFESRYRRPFPGRFRVRIWGLGERARLRQRENARMRERVDGFRKRRGE